MYREVWVNIKCFNEWKGKLQNYYTKNKKKKKKIVKKKILEKVFSLKELGGMIRVLVLTPLSSIFQLYGIVAVSFIDGKNHRPAASNWQNVSHDVESSTPHLSGVQTHNVSGDRHWLQR